jgi:hypothetical protein
MNRLAASMQKHFTRRSVLIFCLTLTLWPRITCAAESWTDALARMPLVVPVTELNRSNCVAVMLGSFQSNDTVKALIFMPGATDEFYFFRRAAAKVTNASPSMLDAVSALTNQTLIRARFLPPLLLIHTAEDPEAPLIRIEDEATAERIKKKKFPNFFLWNDKDWNFVQPILAFEFNTRTLPAPQTHESFHLFRHSMVANHLTAWEALEAISLANKTTVAIQKKKIHFELDTRVNGVAPPPTDWLRPKK